MIKTIENEEQLEDYTERILLSHGCKVQRQAIVDETRNWPYPRKIDIIADFPDLPDLSPLGIELKYMKGVQKGSVPAKAFEQLLFKYGDKTFDGRKLKVIVFGIYIDTKEYLRMEKDDIEWANNVAINTETIIEYFFNYFGIGYIDYKDYSKQDSMTFSFSSARWGKVYVNSPYKDNTNTNPAKIIEKWKYKLVERDIS